ncbi:putative domain XH [Sesbania bispinosa]|nr:putative domain XH [Sesbania bispinosa]
MKMTNHSSEGDVSNQSKGFVNLQKEIERQKQKIIDAVRNSSEKAASISKLKESLNTVMKMTDTEYMLHEECNKELQQMEVMNSNMSNEMECIKKEHEQITKALEESKSLNDLQQKNFTEEIRKNVMKISSLQMAALKQEKDHKNVLKLAEDLKGQNKQLNAKIIQLERQQKGESWLSLEHMQLRRELNVMKDMENEFLKTVATLHMNVMEKERLLQESEDFNQSLIIKEREGNDELQKARKKMIEGIGERSSRCANIGVKRMGEVDTRPFLKVMGAKEKYNKEDAVQRALEVCSMWEKYLADPHCTTNRRIREETPSENTDDSTKENSDGSASEISDDSSGETTDDSSSENSDDS